ncbi:MAG TPA: SRPBCC family protein [Rhizomicrobium sp.]|jgi:uncharacterized protein YndB with AHSA1/START domain|nr:SRPBCC family protein [Rhizomicrobium sp.]
MTDRSVQHGSFTIARKLDAPVALVFRAFADKDHKARWFKGPPQCKEEIREHDFRVGGRDRLRGEWSAGSHPWRISDFTAEYRDIVENARIVYVYEMTMDGTKISVSLATITFAEAGNGTLLTITEQGAFLDGYDDAGSREEGTRSLVDVLAQSLKA